MRVSLDTTRVLFRSAGGSVVLPARRLVLVDRNDGGNLIVNPPRDVWERSELTSEELTQWAFLVAATGRAMIDTLPQLRDGCINYWEAGNWALNDAADPPGRKTAREHRSVHMHLLGRSPAASHPDLRWGEAPKFPDFAERHAWAASFERLAADECTRIVEAASSILREQYAVPAADIEPWNRCSRCGYPTPASQPCSEC